MKHKMKPGEHISRLAKRYGLPNWEIIWNDEANASLRELRRDPHVLQPGDSLEIPEIRHKVEDCATEERHRFEAKFPQLRLRIDIDDFDLVMDGEESPSAGVLHIGGTQRTVDIADDGMIEEWIPVDTEKAVLMVGNQAIHLQVGDLDPEDSPRGQAERLRNLGLLNHDEDEQDTAVLETALMEFQYLHGLTVDGIGGPKTQKKLVEEHGS